MAKASTKPKLDLVRGDDSYAAIPEAFRNVLGYHLRVAQEASFQAFSAAVDKADLKPGWYSILTILSEYGELTPSDLSRVCGRDRSTLTATLKGLVIRGLIERHQNPDDQRSYSVRLTDDGHKMQRRLHAIAHRHDQRLDEIAGEDKDVVLAVLARIVNALGTG
jgi:DNA-binding MarR family transcriptional regulator